MKSDSVEMVWGVKRGPSFALFCGKVSANG